MTAEPLFFCMSVRNSEPWHVAKGSVKVPCSVCIQDCWVSPASAINFKKYPSGRIVCDECIRGELKGEPITYQGPTAEQIAEMRELGWIP